MSERCKVITSSTDPEDIRGWQRLSHCVTTSGKLQEGDPERLAAIGVRHVVNLALDDHAEALADEGEKFAAEGVGYTHIPVPFDAPTKEHYAAFKTAVEGTEGPVHVHCIMNWRVSAFFYVLHRQQGMTETEASALMQQQWDPLASEHPQVLPWRRLIENLAPPA